MQRENIKHREEEKRRPRRPQDKKKTKKTGEDKKESKSKEDIKAEQLTALMIIHQSQSS